MYDIDRRSPKTGCSSRPEWIKRKSEEGGQRSGRGKRARNERASDSFMPTRLVPDNTRFCSETQHETQHNPHEMKSRPEPEARTLSTTEESCPAPPAPLQDLRGANCCLLKPDPAVSWFRYYAVARGKVPGLYQHWDSAKEQVFRYPGACQKKFNTQDDAWAFMTANNDDIKTALQRLNHTPATSPTFQIAKNRSMAQQTPPSSPPILNAHSYTTPTLIPEDSLKSEEYEARLFYETHGLEDQEFSEGSQSQTVPVDDFIPELEPKLSAEQRRVVDLIVEGGKNVFYTGSAGCGKSTILKAFVRDLKRKGKRVNIVGPTNLAALLVGGQTTWAFAGWIPDSMKQPLDKLKAAAHGKEVWNRFDSTDVLVIDEISMVENLLFERLSEIMKASRGEKGHGRPFGDVQIVVTGDFCQLSPVKPFLYCIGCGWELIHERRHGELYHRCENKGCRYDSWPDTDRWAFRSKAWQECEFEHIHLNEIHRQNDKRFISILQKIRRDGIIVPNHANVLLNHASETNNATKIFSLRRDVDRLNREEISKLPSIPHIYHCEDYFDWKPHHQGDPSLKKYTLPGAFGKRSLQQLKEHRYEACLELRAGMRVILQSNISPVHGLVNGAQGTIIGFEAFDPTKVPRKATDKRGDNGVLRGPHADYAHEQIWAFGRENQRQPWPIVEFDNGVRDVIYAECSYSELGNEEERKGENQPRGAPSLLSRTQIPLIAGYAITVHKSQGMTLDRVIVDLRDAFEASQIYVALSRARSLSGLKVVGLPRRHLGGTNKQVKEFLESFMDNRSLHPPSEPVLPSSQVSHLQPSSSQLPLEEQW